MRLVRDLGEAPLSVPSHPIPCLSILPPRCAQFIKEGLEASEQEASPQVPIKPSLPPFLPQTHWLKLPSVCYLVVTLLVPTVGVYLPGTLGPPMKRSLN